MMQKNASATDTPRRFWYGHIQMPDQHGETWEAVFVQEPYKPETAKLRLLDPRDGTTHEFDAAPIGAFFAGWGFDDD